jgi:hypothetical protein
VRSEASALADVERSLRRLAAASAAPVLEVEMHPRMVGRLTGVEASALADIEELTGKRIVVRSAGGSVTLDYCGLMAR